MRGIYFDHKVISHLYSMSAVALFLPRLMLFTFVLASYVPVAWTLAKLVERGLAHKDTPRSVFQKVCIIILNILEIKLSADELEKVKKSQENGSILLSNHVSYLDIIVIGASFGTSFVSKDGIEKWPLFGSIARSIGCVFVERQSLSSRVAALKQTSQKVAAGYNICLFPEGTTTYFGVPSRQRWSSGQVFAALKADRPIVLCGISYEDQESAAWVGRMSFLPHLVKQFLKGSRLVVLNAEVWSCAEDLSVREMSSRIHSRICSLCVLNNYKILSQTAKVEYAYS